MNKSIKEKQSIKGEYTCFSLAGWVKKGGEEIKKLREYIKTTIDASSYSGASEITKGVFEILSLDDVGFTVKVTWSPTAATSTFRVWFNADYIAWG